MRESDSNQGAKFTPGNEILIRELDSHQETRFVPGSQVHSRELGSHSEPCSEKHFDVLKTLISYMLHPNLHLTELNQNTVNYPFPLSPFTHICSLTDFFFLKGKKANIRTCEVIKQIN